MKQALWALGWAIKILWISVIAFGVTVAYSAMSLRAGLGQPRTLSSNGLVTIALPFFINNTGFYEMSDLNITTNIKDYNGTLVSTSTTVVPRIPPNSAIEKTHNVSINMDYLTQNLTHLIFNDSNLTIDAFIAMTFAHAIPLQISTSTTTWWGAPLHNFSIGEISFDLVTQKMTIPLSFENHSPLYINGTMRLEIYNSHKEYLGSGTTGVSVLSNSAYEGKIKVSVDLSRLTEKGQAHLYFESSTFSLGPITMDW